jgi:hypothetical protein
MDPKARWPFPEEGDSCETLLDFAVESTFPASDPIAVEDGFRGKRRRDRARLTAARPAVPPQSR